MCDKLPTFLSHLFYRHRIFSQVFFEPNQYDGYVGASFSCLFYPFMPYVLQAVWGVDAEANEDDMALGVGERS